MATVPTGLSQLSPLAEVKQSPIGIFPARVKKVILSNKDTETAKEFINKGEWSSIGTIFFNSLSTPNNNDNFATNATAKPLFPNVSAIPLENEIVYIMFLPSPQAQEDVSAGQFYYFQSINVWGSTHHNAIPDPLTDDLTPDSQTQDYNETSTGNVQRLSAESANINLGQTFQENFEIRNLLPYEGDYIYQGRWGNTLRFGSTVTDATIPNPWSSTGENGDPILILKNGQHDEDTDSWVPQVEDINTDLSSIYLTSTQTLPIEVASKSYNSYFNAPISTKEFDSEQVIINSGRILFNAKDDNILLSSFDTINLNSLNSLNIDTPKTIIQSKEIYLGDKYATEPVILGDRFLDDFANLLNSITNLCTALSVPIAAYPPVTSVAPLPIEAGKLFIQTQNMIGKIRSYKSKVSKTK